MISTNNTLETFNLPTSLKQDGKLISSSNGFEKQSLKQIENTEISKCNITFSDFDESFRFEIVEIEGDELSNKITFTVEYKDNFSIQFQLNGYWELDKEPNFQVTDVDWIFEELKSSPKSAFILNTFKAILSLSNRVKIEFSDIDYWIEVSMPTPLNIISEILQTRQLAYRLMVIEKALKVSLPFPKRFIEGEEIGNISFCYSAIIERKFDGDCNKLSFFHLAEKDNLTLLPTTNKKFPINFPTDEAVKVIFGKQLNVGQFMIEIPKAIVENYEEAKANLKKLDGKNVEVIIKSDNGLMKYKAITTPTLPKNAFSKNTQNLIDLDEKLDSLMFDKYINSFSDAFEGLDDEQIQAITKRPSLDEEAFNF